MALLYIHRPILPLDHQLLRKHIDNVNRLGDYGIRWRQLGKTGATIIHPGQYQMAVNEQAGKLAAINTVQLAQEFNQSILPGMPGGKVRLTTPVTGVEFFGEGLRVSGRLKSIVYLLGSEALTSEWSYMTTELDRRNEVNAEWDPIEPHVTVATVPVEHADDDILDTFWDFAPHYLTLQRPIAQVV